MKVKKFDNLWLMGIILCATILLGVYVVKVIFPEFVIEVAQIRTICEIGEFIDTHQWAYYLVTFCVSFFVYYIYCCACCQKKKLNFWENIGICVTIIALFLIQKYFPNQYTVINIISLIFLPFIYGGNFKSTCICFISTNLLQTITLEIRSLGLSVINFNYATFTVLMIDYYILLVLLYLLFNFKKGEE